jgi:hypothetical protein
LIASDFVNAAKIAAAAPGTLIRNNETYNKIKTL